MDTKGIIQALIDHFGGEVALAEELGVSQSTVNRWMHGIDPRGANHQKVMALARTIQASAHLVDTPPNIKPASFSPTIIPGAGLVGQNNLPVYAAAMGGDGHQIVTFDAIDYVKRPSILEHVKDGYGIYIVGDSMSPAFEPGDMALVNPHLPPVRGKNVVLFHTPPVDEAECMIKRLVSYSDRDWRLKQFNPMNEFDVARVDWPICHRVVGKYDAR